MPPYLVRAAKSFAWLAGIAGSVVSIALLDRWGILLGSLIALALGVAAVPYGRTAVTRLLEYPAVRQRAADLEARVTLLEGEVTRLADANARRYEQGIDEGKSQVLGEIAASAMGLPTLVAVYESEGEIVLMASVDAIDTAVVGARFDVRTAEPGDRKGVVEVFSIDLESERIHLRCVDRTVPEFWEELERWVVLNATPPPGIELAAFVHTPPTRLSEGGG